MSGRSTAVAQVVDGPEELLGRTLCVLGDVDAPHGTLDDGEVDRAVTAQAADAPECLRTVMDAVLSLKTQLVLPLQFEALHEAASPY